MFSSIYGECGAAASRIDSDGITIASVCSGGENASAYNLLFADRILHGKKTMQAVKPLPTLIKEKEPLWCRVVKKHQWGSRGLQAWPETGSWWELITVLERARLVWTRLAAKFTESTWSLEASFFTCMALPSVYVIDFQFCTLGMCGLLYWLTFCVMKRCFATGWC